MKKNGDSFNNLLTSAPVQQVALKAHGFHSYIQDTINQPATTLDVIREAREIIRDAQSIRSLPLCHIVALAAAIRQAEETVLSLIPTSKSVSIGTLLQRIQGNVDEYVKKAFIASDLVWYTQELARVATSLTAKIAIVAWELALVTAKMALASANGDSPESVLSGQDLRCANKGRLRLDWKQSRNFDEVTHRMLQAMERFKKEAPHEKQRQDLRVIEKQHKLPFRPKSTTVKSKKSSRRGSGYSPFG